MRDGEVLHLLADAATGVPDPYVTRFILATLRQSGSSSGTIKRALEGVRIGLNFLDDRGIELADRIGGGIFLDADELASLSDLCRRRKKGDGMVVGPVAASRFASFGSYVAYRTEEVATFAGIKSRQHIVASLARFERRASKVAPRASQGATGNERLGLEIAQRELLLRIIQPSDPGNPFKPKLRIRNHAMILLAYVFGWRAGEELGLKGKDYDVRSTPATLTVHRRPGDPEETRNEPPLAKTLSRTLYVDGDTRPAMDAWIKDRQDRSKYPKARKHPYIFVATDGSPLTLRGARAVYERLGSAYPELAGITQHILRHDANDRWIEYNEAQGLDPTSSRQDQCYAMGWSSTSKQPDIYAKAAIRRRSNDRIADQQRAMTRSDTE